MDEPEFWMGFPVTLIKYKNPFRKIDLKRRIPFNEREQIEYSSRTKYSGGWGKRFFLTKKDKNRIRGVVSEKYLELRYGYMPNLKSQENGLWLCNNLLKLKIKFMEIKALMQDEIIRGLYTPRNQSPVEDYLWFDYWLNYYDYGGLRE